MTMYKKVDTDDHLETGRLVKTVCLFLECKVVIKFFERLLKKFMTAFKIEARSIDKGTRCHVRKDYADYI